MMYRALFLALLLAAGLAHAQPYRWTDDRGAVRYSDRPPPATAKNVEKLDINVQKPQAAPMPYQLSRLQKDFSVTLYTSPDCEESCALARGALNKRGVPFKEVQVWNPETNEELKRASGAAMVPTLLVGRSALRGFEQGAFDSLLDSAGYPPAGALPPLSQKAPPAPEGFVAGGGAAAPAKPQPAPAQQKAGPYDTSGLVGPAPKPGPYDTSGLVGPAPKPGPYDTSGLVGPPPKPGPYRIPGESR